MAGEGTDFLESSQLVVTSLPCVVISTEVRERNLVGHAKFAILHNRFA